MREWMTRLAEKHRAMRQAHPTEELAVILDIDDTILDLRHMALHVLQAFDRHHGKAFFQGFSVQDIGVMETRINEMIAELRLPSAEEARVTTWFKKRSWSPAVVRNGHRPFPGAMDVIRWLQSQPGTVVGLNTGRPECIRKETLVCLRGIGRSCGVDFSNELLFMNPHGWGKRIVQSKVDGIGSFRKKGYRIAAFMDNEPENLKAVADIDKSGEILLLHADTLFGTKRQDIPPNAVSGNIFDVSRLSQNGDDFDKFGKAA